MDSSVSPTYGDQEGTAYNGHFGCTCYHPLFVFNQFGDLERCALRPGNVHSAEGWRAVLEPVVARDRTTIKRRSFRTDAAFAAPEVYDFLEAEDYGYVSGCETSLALATTLRALGKTEGSLGGLWRGLTSSGAAARRSWTTLSGDRPFRTR